MHSRRVTIAPAEVEPVLQTDPVMADAGVFSLPHPSLREAVAAVVIRLGALTT